MLRVHLLHNILHHFYVRRVLTCIHCTQHNPIKKMVPPREDNWNLDFSNRGKSHSQLRIHFAKMAKILVVSMPIFSPFNILCILLNLTAQFINTTKKKEKEETLQVVPPESDANIICLN